MTFSSHSTNLVVRFSRLHTFTHRSGCWSKSLVSLKVLILLMNFGENPLLVAGFITACTGIFNPKIDKSQVFPPVHPRIDWIF